MSTAAARTFADLLHNQLVALADGLQSESGVPGLGIAVSTPHGVVEVASGVGSIETGASLQEGAHFHIGCIAKLLLSIVTLELAQNGTVGLNTPIAEYLPELRNSPLAKEVALVHLLSHTAGYRSFPLSHEATLALTWSRFVEELSAGRRLFEPGRVFSYEHTESVLICEIVRRATARSPMELVEGMCMRLGLDLSEPSVNDSGVRHQAGQHAIDVASRRYSVTSNAPYSAGGRISREFWLPVFPNRTLSLRDVAMIGRALCGSASEVFDGEPAISAPVRGLMQHSVVRIPRFMQAPQVPIAFPAGFSLGAAQYEGGWHGLSALSTGQCIALRYHPRLQVSVAVGINAVVPQLLDLAVNWTCSIASGEPYTAVQMPACEFEPVELEGRYESGGPIDCDVRARGDGLTCVFLDRTSASEIEVDVAFAAGSSSVSSRFPGAALAFFRTSEPQPQCGLMFGLSAYRRTGPLEK